MLGVVVGVHVSRCVERPVARQAHLNAAVSHSTSQVDIVHVLPEATLVVEEGLPFKEYLSRVRALIRVRMGSVGVAFRMIRFSWR